MTVLITKSLQKQGINDHMKAFKQAMLNAGMPNVPDSIYITSGDVTRWKDTNKQGNNKDCWYIFGINSNGTGFGKFGNHKDIRAKWHSSHNKKLPNLKLTKQQQRICKEAKTLTDQAIKQVKEFCIEKARELWNSARPITKQNEHPWLIQKKIPFDIFKITTHNFSFQLPDTKKKQIIYKGALLLPIWNPNNEIVSLQYIGQKPNEKEKYQKYTFPRTSVKNGVTILGNIKSSELVYISESVSTGYTVLKASGLPVICGAGKAGFKHCIEFVKKNYPKKEIILIGDNDLTNTDVNGKPYNDGKIAVEKAAKEYNLKYVLSPVESDFNDLFVQELQQTNDERIAYAKVKEALKNIQTPEAKKKQKIPLSGYIKEPEPFPLEALPEPFVPWAKEIVYHMQCPPEFIALSVMTTLSSFIARKSTIKPENFSNWFVIPNLWGMLIADIGVSKSPPQKELIKMITPFQIKANQDFEKAQKEYKQQVWAYKQALKKAGKEFEKSKDVTKKPLDFLTPNIKEPEEPQQFHYFTTDHTPEALSKLLIVNSCPFIWCDEIKRLIKKFDSKGHEGERQDFLSLYDGTTQSK